MAMNTNISNAGERNQLNLAIRTQPWYQDWFRARGLNPNQVKLSDGQRKELQQLVVSKGFLDPSDGHIDPAGNVSDFHGWKGLPTAAKIAIMAGAAVGTAGAAGAFSGGGGIAGAAGGGGGAAGGGGGTAAGLTAAIAPEVGIGGLSTASLATIPGVSTGLGTGALTAGAGLSAIPSSTLGTGLGMTPSLAGSTAAGTGSLAGGAQGGSMISRLMDTQNLADTGKLLQNFGNDEANNRLTRGNQTQNYDQLMLNAAGNRRTDESDALKKLNQTAYINSGGRQDQPPPTLSGGRTMPTFNFPKAPPISDAQRQAASSLEGTLLDRLKNGSYNPTNPSTYTERGTAENIGRWGSLATTGLGWYNNVFG